MGAKGNVPIGDVRLVVYEGRDDTAEGQQRLVDLPSLLLALTLRGGAYQSVVAAALKQRLQVRVERFRIVLVTMAPERPTHSEPARSTRFRVPVFISSSSSTVFSFMKIFSVKIE